jgi:hypothetical protein
VVQHDLGERHEGNGEPDDLSVRRLLVSLAAGALLAATQGCATPPGPVVMASGRDDHGLLMRPAIALQRSPTDQTVVGSVPDGAFLRVLREDHSWAYVRTIVEPFEEGWVNDHYLRGVATLLSGGEQVRLADARRQGGRIEIGVTPVNAVAGAPIRWVEASELREVGAR